MDTDAVPTPSQRKEQIERELQALDSEYRGVSLPVEVAAHCRALEEELDGLEDQISAEME